MTIESNGQAFTFEGMLVSTEVSIEKDDYPEFGSQDFTYVGPPRYNISLEITARGMEQHVLGR